MENWQKVMAVSHMQDHIASHLNERMTLAELAQKAGYSPWHAARIFKQLTGRAPFDYIRALRLSKAAARLHDGHKVVDVAFDFVFPKAMRATNRRSSCLCRLGFVIITSQCNKEKRKWPTRIRYLFRWWKDRQES